MIIETSSGRVSHGRLDTSMGKCWPLASIHLRYHGIIDLTVLELESVTYGNSFAGLCMHVVAVVKLNYFKKVFFFLIHLFAPAILVMKVLEIEETKAIKYATCN